MAALYGRLNSNIGSTARTRTGSQWIESTVETWTGIVRVELDRDGAFLVEISGKHGESRATLAYGDLQQRTVSALPFSPAEIGSADWSIQTPPRAVLDAGQALQRLRGRLQTTDTDLLQELDAAAVALECLGFGGLRELEAQV